ncbi:MAG: hypothetical protein Kow0089_24030 [Desulfobulbaceae bacterium]
MSTTAYLLLRMVFLLLLAVAILLPTAACTSMPDGNAANGERWFRLNRCNGCHGERGTGGRGPTLAGLDLSYRRFIGKLRNPKSAVMPTFGEERLSDSDAADIYLWLRSLENK